MIAALAWQDWLGFAGAALMLLALFLHLFAPGDGRGRTRAVLGLLGASALLPAALARFNPALFFLLVAWILLNAYRLFRARARP